jgi:hypothetical protein
MKNVRDVYQKLREVKYHYLIKLYKKYLKKVPSNCRYNYLYTNFPLNGNDFQPSISLCLLHQPDLDLKSGIFPHLVDICQEPKHCINCNAFVFKHTKESIKEHLEGQLKDPKIRAANYPDICALEWVLERTPESGIEPVSFIKKIWIKFKFFIENLFHEHN